MLAQICKTDLPEESVVPVTTTIVEDCDCSRVAHCCFDAARAHRLHVEMGRSRHMCQSVYRVVACHHMQRAPLTPEKAGVRAARV